ncbi:MAG: PHP domain-containing protein [Bacillota bacterium]
MKKLLIMLTLLTTIIVLSACNDTTPAFTTTLSVNPYERVDWNTTTHNLANLHTHTTNSDGASMPHEVVEYYRALGYDILALTDHDQYTYDWNFSTIDASYEDVDPGDMLAIPGNEFSEHEHDVVALFTDYMYEEGTTITTSMDRIIEDEGMMFMAHPGRYWKIYSTYESGDEFSPSWYMNFFNTYPLESLLGIEVFNRQDNYENDRALWDRLLSESMPERPIWGFGNDDFHGADGDSRINWSFNHFLVDTLSIDTFKESMIQGAFYASHTNQVDDDAPMILEIIVNEDERYIEIVADEYESIRWFSGTDETLNTSIEVDEGKRFYYGNFEGTYVRAEIWKDELNKNVTVTQPFGFTHED